VNSNKKTFILIVKKRHSSSYETDQGDKPRKFLLTSVRRVGLPAHR